jgi:hypothetical protein
MCTAHGRLTFVLEKAGGCSRCKSYVFDVCDEVICEPLVYHKQK